MTRRSSAKSSRRHELVGISEDGGATWKFVDGAHTPLFNAIVCGPWHHEEPTRLLLQHGASKDARVSLRKFLDWIEAPRWHEAHDVTAAAWARGFPDQGWVNGKALRLLD